MKPTDLGLPAKFAEFRSYPGFDQFATALDLATAPERFQVLNASTGCLSGDAKIQIARGSGVRASRKVPIAKEFRAQYHRSRNPEVKSYTRSLIEGTLQHQEVREIVFSGIKETCTLTTTRGDCLRATPDHEILTSNGFCPLASLDGSSRIVVDMGILAGRQRKPKINYRVVAGLRHHPYAGHAESRTINPEHRQHKPHGRLFRVALHRLVVEAHLNSISVDVLIEICRTSPAAMVGLRFLDPAEWAVHHKDHNPNNNELSNLEVLSHSDHARVHDPIQHLQHQVGEAGVRSIERHGREDVYDLVTVGGYPNFIANGIVVHNSGKSATYSAAAALRQARVLVLVGTKGLQEQLLGDGLVQRLVWGHRNYSCMGRASRMGLDGFGDPDADADDLEFRCLVPRDRCTYLGDVEAAKVSRSVVCNYAYWMSIARYSDPGLLGEFDLLVCDEAHSAVTWLTKAVSVYLSRARVGRLLGMTRYPQLPGAATIEGWRDWAGEYAMRGYERLGAIPREERAERRKVERLVRDLELLVRAAGGQDPALTEPWIVVPGDNGAATSATFSPRYPRDFAEALLFRKIPHVLLTSATVTETHCDWLGIPAAERRYREVPSPFDVRRRPVIWVPTTRVDFRMSDGAKWKLGQRVDELIQAAIEQGAGNGLIHTGSYERNRETVAASKWRPAIITHRQDSADFNAALERFKEAGRAGRFAVLASPRMQEGVDLPDDLARWAIILKVPFPDGRDPLTRARAKDARYRDVVVAETIMQTCGRPVRGVGDFATTWVLDDHWGQHAAWKCPFPAWFRAGFQTLRADAPVVFRFLTREIVERMPPLPAPRVVELIGA